MEPISEFGINQVGFDRYPILLNIFVIETGASKMGFSLKSYIKTHHRNGYISYVMLFCLLSIISLVTPVYLTFFTNITCYDNYDEKDRIVQNILNNGIGFKNVEMMLYPPKLLKTMVTKED